jgi:hypothetical protein
MSETINPEEQPVAVATEVPVVEAESTPAPAGDVATDAVVEETPAVTESAPVIVTEAAPVQEAEEAVATDNASPVEEGVLGYKAPGLIK